jgi:hypothetical protein
MTTLMTVERVGGDATYQVADDPRRWWILAVLGSHS